MRKSSLKTHLSKGMIKIFMLSIFQDQEGLKSQYIEFSENRDFLNFSRFFGTQILVIYSQLSQNICISDAFSNGSNFCRLLLLILIDFFQL